MYIVNINEEEALCKKCGADIMDIKNIAYDGKYKVDPKYREELCHCKSCNTKFIMHYDIFDKNGHVCSRVFSEDINNPEFHWQDLYTDVQVKGIIAHMVSCKICQDKLSEEILNDAWLASVIHKK